MLNEMWGAKVGMAPRTSHYRETTRSMRCHTCDGRGWIPPHHNDGLARRGKIGRVCPDCIGGISHCCDGEDVDLSKDKDNAND